MTKPVPGIKIQYLQESQYPEVEGTRCVQVKIPDDDAYMPVLAGLLSIATKWFNYARVDKAKARAVAELWRNAYLETDWDECMNCEKIIDCFENDADVQEAFKQLLLQLLQNDIDVQNATAQAVQQAKNGEAPLSSDSQNGNMLNGLPSCAFDNLWGASVGLVAWLDLNNQDFLDKLAVAATPAARGAALSKGIKGFSGAALGEALSVAVTFLSSQMVNNYDAFYDVDYANQLACEIFCLSQGSCEISLRQLYLIFAARVGYTPTADLFYQGFLFAVTGEWTGVNFCDIMMFIQVGAFIFMGGFQGWDGINPITNALSLGWDSPRDDWMTLCECPDIWTHTIHADDITSGLLVLPDDTVGSITGTEISQTTGVSFGQDITGIQGMIVFPSIQTIYGMAIHATGVTGVDAGDVVNHFFVYRDAAGVPIGSTGATLPDENGDWDASYSEATPGVKTIPFQYVYLGTDQTMTFEIIISGFGTNPFE